MRWLFLRLFMLRATIDTGSIACEIGKCLIKFENPRQRMNIVLGIMSGTSLDGVDYALCEISPGRIKLHAHWHVPFPAKLRQRLAAAAANRSTTYEVGRLHHDLG